MSKNWHNIYIHCIITRQTKQSVSGTAKDNLKKRFYENRKLFNEETSANDSPLSKYVWGRKETSNVNPTLVRSIVKKVPLYLNISKRCLLCLQEKPKIINYPRSDELHNKRCELKFNCRHANKFLLRNYKTNHWL